MHLYEIKNEIMDVFFNQIDDEGELNHAALQKLDFLDVDFKEKALAIGAHIKNLEADYESFENHLLKMERKKKKIANKIKSLKAYLAHNLKALNYDKIECPQFNITPCQSARVLIESDATLPDEYMVSRITWEPNKLLIGEDLKKGKEIKGAKLEINHYVKIN